MRNCKRTDTMMEACAQKKWSAALIGLLCCIANANASLAGPSVCPFHLPRRLPTSTLSLNRMNRAKTLKYSLVKLMPAKSYHRALC